MLLEGTPLVTNDAIVVGILLSVLALVFGTHSSSKPFFKKFYRVIPAILLCYFIPSLFATFGIISDEHSGVYHVASRYLLPACLVLLTLSIDMKAVIRLGPKAVIMFASGTIGVIIGGPIALLAISAVFPEVVGGQGPEEVWRGLSTLAGSWIGGGANMLAMENMWKPSNDLFSVMVVIDVIVANIWMGFLLFGAGMSRRIDKLFKADSSAIDDLKVRMENYVASISRIPKLSDFMLMLGIAFACAAIGHIVGDSLGPWINDVAPGLSKFGLTSSFFWLIVVATTLGLALSFTRVRTLEGAGASKIGSVFIYFLVATIGMKMNWTAVADYPELFLVGFLWMLIHVAILLGVAKIIKAPFFFTAVGSQANIGGAASAPVVASAFHPSLASVGVLLAVLGYAAGTYGALLCAILMQGVS